MVKQIEIFRL